MSALTPTVNHDWDKLGKRGKEKEEEEVKGRGRKEDTWEGFYCTIRVSARMHTI